MWYLLWDTVLTHTYIMGVPFSDHFLDAILLRGVSWFYPVLPGQYTFRAATARFHIPSTNYPLISRHCVSPHPYHPFIKFTISQVNEVASFFQVLTSKWKFLIIFLSNFILVAEEDLPLIELNFPVSSMVLQSVRIQIQFFFLACSYIEIWRKYTMIGRQTVYFYHDVT